MKQLLTELDPQLLLVGAACLVALLAAVAAFLSRRRSNDDMTHRLAEAQAVLADRLTQLADAVATGQNMVGERLQVQERALSKTLDERLADVSRRIGESLQKQSIDSANTMGDLKERLAIIGKAQENITKLSADVVSLQEVLSNKQSRGAFGESQLSDQVRNALPPSAYAFQVTMSNKTRVDCLLTLPNPPGPIAIDAKFPLESFHLLRKAETSADRVVARRAFAADVLKHV
ncbi:MAG: DNA recombination protein RmuC, partial [Alphaproteobacteria bacterium]|nr:DNA recombination protein RmuC [Alphaproteobacteria bacterium]